MKGTPLKRGAVVSAAALLTLGLVAGGSLPALANDDVNSGGSGSTAPATPGAPAVTAEQLTLTNGSANWDFVTSFREYVGSEGETRSEGADIVAGTRHLQWPAADNQQFDTAKPTKLSFKGKVGWYKYNGILNVSLANPTIDFDKKQLLVDAQTAGTLGGAEAATFTQQALLSLPDLKWEIKDNYLLVYSLKPTITDLSTKIVGFYSGESREPFVATFEIHGREGDRPAPVLWNLFPESFKNPTTSTEPVVDKDTFDVEVPDPQLRKCILNELDLAPETPIVNQVLQRMQSVDCIGVRLAEEDKIKTLEGLQYATNLKRLRVTYQNITDLTPLGKSVKLADLDVSHNKLTSLRGLETLKALDGLKATNNRISDISALAGIETLSSLDLEDNRLTELAHVSGENLRNLKVKKNRLQNLDYMTSLPRVTALDASDNRITDVKGLKPLRVIETIDLRNNFISDTTPLTELKSFALRGIRVTNNKFTDWSELREELEGKLWGAPREGDNPEEYVNPKNLEDALAEDLKTDAAEAEAANPVVSQNVTSEGEFGAAQSAAADSLFKNVPVGSTFELEGAVDGAVVIADQGQYSIVDGAVVFTPAAKFVGTATPVTAVVTTPAGNTHKATFTPTVNLPAAKAPAVADLTEAAKGEVEVPKSVFKGDTIPVKVGAAHAGKEVSLWLFSEPQPLGKQTVDAEGNVSVKLPESVTGEHRIAVTDRVNDLVGWDAVTIKEQAPADNGAAPGAGNDNGTAPGAGNDNGAGTGTGTAPGTDNGAGNGAGTAPGNDNGAGSAPGTTPGATPGDTPGATPGGDTGNTGTTPGTTPGATPGGDTGNAGGNPGTAPSTPGTPGTTPGTTPGGDNSGAPGATQPPAATPPASSQADTPKPADNSAKGANTANTAGDKAASAQLAKTGADSAAALLAGAALLLVGIAVTAVTAVRRARRS